LNLLIHGIQVCSDTAKEGLKTVNTFFKEIEPARKEHEECREKEVEVESDMSEACSRYNAYRSTPPGNMPPKCMNELTSADISTTDEEKKTSMEHCIVAIEAWVTPLVTQYKACHASSTVVSDQRTMCERAQGDFEADYCQWSVALGTTCWNQAKCRNESIALANKGAEQLTKSEHARETDCMLGQKVKCLLKIFGEQDAAKRKSDLEACKVLKPECPDKIKAPAIPIATPCELANTGPCEDDFLEQAYRTKSWYHKAPAGECRPCVTAQGFGGRLFGKFGRKIGREILVSGVLSGLAGAAGGLFGGGEEESL